MCLNSESHCYISSCLIGSPNLINPVTPQACPWSTPVYETVKLSGLRQSEICLVSLSEVNGLTSQYRENIVDVTHCH